MRRRRVDRRLERYFFHLESERRLEDRDGTLLPNDGAARAHAVQMMAELLSSYVTEVLQAGRIRIHVTDEAAIPLFVLDLTEQPSGRSTGAT